jgi:hypothetical protein
MSFELLTTFCQDSQNSRNKITQNEGLIGYHISFVSWFLGFLHIAKPNTPNGR